MRQVLRVEACSVVDRRAVTITEDFGILGVNVGVLTVLPEHEVDLSCLRYHREHIFVQ